MKASLISNFFHRDEHNPSYFTIQSKSQYQGEMIDYCVPINHYFPPQEMVDRINENLLDILKYYPDYADLHQQNISRFIGIPSENIVPVNGSTELITLLCKEMKGSVVCPIPTFGRWTDLPISFETEVHFIQRAETDNFALDVQTIVDKVCAEKADNLIICNPNNPTGASFSYSQVCELIEQLKDIECIIIDESFIDFSDIKSAAGLAVNANNVVVLKSMGKALGWHGIRLGYGVTNQEMAEKLRLSIPYWNVNGMAAFVLNNLNDFTHQYKESFKQVKQDRAYLSSALAKLKQCAIYPSAANFVYLKLPSCYSGKKIRDTLSEEHGIVIRECSNKLGSCENYFRIAVRKQADTDLLLKAFMQVMS